MAGSAKSYRVVTHLAGGGSTVHDGNGRPFTKHAATRFARLQAKTPQPVVRVEVQKVETVETIVPAAAAHAEAVSDAGRRLAS